jgi:hypothetical protein
VSFSFISSISKKFTPDRIFGRDNHYAGLQGRSKACRQAGGEAGQRIEETGGGQVEVGAVLFFGWFCPGATPLQKFGIDSKDGFVFARFQPFKAFGKVIGPNIIRPGRYRLKDFDQALKCSSVPII